jgi:mannose-6-phosphate isomerase-like protein (cupin superfamily)
MPSNYGTPLWVVGHKLTAIPTTGDYAFADIETSPEGPGPPLHHHVEADELFYVAEGTIEFMRDGAWHPVEKGSTFSVPKGTLHTFRAGGGAPARFISIHDPGAAMDTLFLSHGVPVEEPNGFERSVSEEAIEAFTAAAAHDVITQAPEPA